MVGVFEIHDHALEARPESLLGVAARGRGGKVVNATVRTVQAVLLHFNHLGADGRKLKQLMAPFESLRLGSEVGSTTLASDHALLSQLIGCLAPLAGGARMTRLRPVFGFVLGKPMLGLVVARGRLRGIGRCGQRFRRRRQLGFQLLNLVE
jgi:hypothetical protein